MSRTLSITSQAFPPKLFSPVKLSGNEQCNHLFDYTLILKTPDTDPIGLLDAVGLSMPQASIDLTNWLGKPIQVAIELDGKEIPSIQNIRGLKRPFTTR